MPVKEVSHLSFKDKNNIQNLDKYVRSNYFRKDLIPGEFTGNAYFSQHFSTIDVSYILFLDSESKGIILTFPRPELWINGDFTVTLFYSIAAGTGTDKFFDVDVYGIAEGDGITQGTTLSSYEVSVSSPTTNEIYRDDEEVTTPIIADYDLISIRVSHDGTIGKDDHTGNLRFHGGYMTYHPVNPQ